MIELYIKDFNTAKDLVDAVPLGAEFRVLGPLSGVQMLEIIELCTPNKTLTILDSLVKASHLNE